jgi:hypothetical protein
MQGVNAERRFAFEIVCYGRSRRKRGKPVDHVWPPPALAAAICQPRSFKSPVPAIVCPRTLLTRWSPVALQAPYRADVILDALPVICRPFLSRRPRRPPPLVSPEPARAPRLAPFAPCASATQGTTRIRFPPVFHGCRRGAKAQIVDRASDNTIGRTLKKHSQAPPIPRLSCSFSRVPDVKSHPLSCLGCHL